MHRRNCNSSVPLVNTAQPMVCILGLLSLVALNGCGSSSGIGDDDDDASNSTSVFSETFERDESSLEHDYPGYSYYDKDTQFNIGDGPSGFFETNHSTVYGYFQTKSCADDDYYRTVKFVYEKSPIDLSHCTSGNISFDWGYDDITTYSKYEIKTDVYYSGMGSDDSVTPSGTWSNDYDWMKCTGCTATFGPEHVTYPLDYGCGHETDGTITISLSQYLYTGYNDGENCSSSDYIGGLLWIDNITVDID